MAEWAGGGNIESLERPTVTSPTRYKHWIQPLKRMEKQQMPHELACFATRYLVEEALARGMSVDHLLQDLPPWLTLDHLTNTSSQVSHGVFIALAERLKEYVGNPDPWFIGEVAHRAAAFDDPVTNMVRRWGTVSGAIKFTTFLGKFVTKDQHADARETGIQKGRRTGRTIHYFLKGQEGTYFEQTTATVGYYESLTRLWPNITPQPELVTVEHRLSRFAPEQLLGDVYYYARNGMRFARDAERKFRINGEVYAEPVDVNKLQAEWSFDTSKVNEPPRPVRMIRPWEHDGKVLIPEGLILDAPASVYVWSYDRLPPVNLFQAVIEGMRQRFGGRKYINEVIGQVEAERDRAEEQLEEANRQRAEAERQRGIAEEGARRIAYAAWAGGHLLEGAGSEATSQAGMIMGNLEGMISALNGMSARLAVHPDVDLKRTIAEMRGYLEEEGLPGLSQIETVLGITAVTFGPVNTLFAGEYEKLKREGVNLRGIADDIAARLSRTERYTGRNTQIRVEGSVAQLEGYDPGLVTAYLFNLVNNAVWSVHQYQPVEGGKITVGIEDDADKITLRVTDNGLGLAPDQHHAYLQGSIPSRKGMGSKSLGTQSGKVIAEYYDFERRVESKPNEGFGITTHIKRRAEYHHPEQTGR